MASNCPNEQIYLRNREFVIREQGIYEMMFTTGGHSAPVILDDDDSARSFLRDVILGYCEEYQDTYDSLLDCAIVQIGLIRDRCSGCTVEPRNKIIAYGKDVISL